MKSNGFDVIGVSSSGTDLQQVHISEGVPVVSIEMTRTISPLKDLKALWNFYNFCMKEKPQIVHSHTPKAGIVGMLGAKLAGVPIRMHTVAGLPLMEASGFKRMILNFVEKLTYSSATHIFPNSNGLYDFIIENNFAKLDKVKVIANGSSNGIDTSFFSKSQVSTEILEKLKDSYSITENCFVFVFVGRLVTDKGINELVSAFTKISNAAVKLLLVGALESELDPLLPETLQEINNNPKIIAVGFQRDVRPYLAISNALVFPSYREGFPNVVMQAGAMELPCIVSNINGCNEIVTEGENGMIVPVKDANKLYAALLKLVDDKEFYQNLKSNARQMITSRYEQNVVWEALLSEYQMLLKKKDINYV